MRILYLLALILVLPLLGCQSVGDHLNCMAEVDGNVPAQTQQRYVRTDTKCKTSGGAIASPTTTRGDQYIVNNDSQTNCTSTPVYETIILNGAQRDAAYQQCRNRLANQRVQQNQPQTQVQSSAPSRINQTTPNAADEIGRQFGACWHSLMQKNGSFEIYNEIILQYPNSPNREALLQKNFKLTEEQKALLNRFTDEDSCISSAISNSSSFPNLRDLFKGLYASQSALRKSLIGGSITIAQANQKRSKDLSDFSIQLRKVSTFGNSNWLSLPPTSNQPLPAPVSVTQTKSAMPIAQGPLTMEQAKQKCLDLGFRVGTESFGQCVLKMAK